MAKTKRTKTTKRATKKTEIVVSTKPRQDLDLLRSPPPVTLADTEQGHAEFRRLHRELFVGGMRQSIETLASMQKDLRDANKLQVAAIG